MDEVQEEDFLARLANEKMSEDDILSALRNWEKDVGKIEDINGCAACGVEDFQRVTLHEPQDLETLRLSPAEVLTNVGPCPGTLFRFLVATMYKFINIHRTLSCRFKFFFFQKNALLSSKNQNQEPHRVLFRQKINPKHKKMKSPSAT